IRGSRIDGHRSRRSTNYVAANDTWYLEIQGTAGTDNSAADSGARISYDENAPKRITSAASSLAKDPKYKAGKQVDGKLVTHCSEFVRDVGKSVGQDIPELRGQARDQFNQLTLASDGASGKWASFSTASNTAEVFQKAQDAANAGKLVV